MAGKSRRARQARRSMAPRLEPLETRALLNGDLPTGSASTPLDPATSLLVRFQANAPAAATRAALAAVGGRVVESFSDGPSVVTIPSNVDPSVALGLLKANPSVVYAEPDATIHAAGIPNDPYFSSDWGLNNADNVDIDAPEAWSVSTGNSAVIVAVLDTGVDLSNPDLTSRLWTNPTAGMDGFSNDLHGWNFVAHTGNVNDNNGHGSHVTGILAAAGNNGNGIAGVDWNAQIMPLKILGSDGGGSTQDAISAIYFAANHGARVINASWGGNQYSQAMRDAINYASSKGAVFVTAAGNDGRNDDTTSANYPANYRLPNELVVAAVDSAGNLASFSNYGAHTVDLAAPGVGIWSTIPGGYAAYTGTSMATPYVSGVVSLLAGQHPEFGAAELVQRVIATVKPLASLRDTTVGGGIVDAYNALTASATSATQMLGSSLDALSPGRARYSDIENAILATDSTYQAFGGTAAGYVTRLFQSIFGRDPDPTALAYYSGQIDSGTPRKAVIHELQSYDEAKRTEVARWYQDELGWNLPLADLKINSGVMYWAGLIDGGLSDETVHALILSYGITPGGSSADYVAGLYRSIFGRDPDPTGVAYYAGLIDQGGSRLGIAQSLLSSFEARRTEIARLYQVELGWAIPLANLKVNDGIVYWAGFIGGW